MQEVFLSDNNAHRVPPADAPDPIQASGQKLTNGSADTNTTATVVGGATYAFTSMITGGFMFGILDSTTAANVAWCCPLYKTIIIVIPLGTTTLHYNTNVNDGIGYLRRLN